MSSTLVHQIAVSIDHRRIERRDFLRTVAAGGLAAGAWSWTDVLKVKADELRARGMACILLWMQGGPSQFETFAPQPGHVNGGSTQAIASSVPGIAIAENLPRLARVMDEICIVRSMTGKEGSHPRATYLMHTGYLPTASVKHPTLGSNVAHQLGDRQSELPNFVRVGRGRLDAGAGLLGIDFDPFVVTSATRVPDNTTITTSTERFRRRLQLLETLGGHAADSGHAQIVADHQKIYDQAARMVLSPRMDVFDLERESPAIRDAYGSGDFAAGCLLARRLVEAGVTFVEVTLGGWDTHEDNFRRCGQVCGTLDQPFAQLVTDLKERGMLDRTLIVWMGEFGRTPRINGRTGRDHYPRAFTVALAGGGIRGGQVIGATDPSGSEVVDRPVTVPDLFATVFQTLGIDPTAENLSDIGRPIKLVEGGQVVREALN
jgi:hypothetical protein